MSITPMTVGFKPDVLNYAWRDYGVRVGVWRIMEVMERQGFPATAALNSEVSLHYPEIIQEGNRLGWEWMAHGPTKRCAGHAAARCARIAYRNRVGGAARLRWPRASVEQKKVDEAGEAKWCGAYRPAVEKYKDGLFEPAR